MKDLLQMGVLIGQENQHSKVKEVISVIYWYKTISV